MPKATRRNPTKYQRSFSAGATGAGYVEPVEVAPIQSCDICASTVYLRELTDDEGHRIVACRGCLEAAEVPASKTRKVQEQQPVGKPGEMASLKRMASTSGGGSGLAWTDRPSWKMSKSKRECAWPGCSRMVKWLVCSDHTEFIPRHLIDEFWVGWKKGGNDRREAFKRIERFIAVRARLREKSST